MKIKAFFLILGLLFSPTAVRAQPEVIDVKTYEIHKKIYWTVAKFVMTARDSSGTLVEYVGTGNYTVAPLMSCNSCSLPNVFSSNGFFTEPFGVKFIAGFDTPVEFHVTSIEAEPIVLRPTILRKKSLIVREGAVSVKGRIEVKSAGVTIAVDNSVDLAGTYSAEFVPLSNADGRKIQFTIINYSLSQTQ